MERFKNIDMLRFAFAVLIVMFHFGKSSEIIKPIIQNSFMTGIISNCHYCVNFFFIIAGFFLFQTINTKQSTFEFAKKRFFRLAPLLWLFIFFQFLLSVTIHTYFSFDGSILKLFLLHNLGFAPHTGGPSFAWFISVLFWVSIFYFYIYKIMDKKYLNLIIWLITVCGISLILHHNNFNINSIDAKALCFIHLGVIRGLYGMGIGYFYQNYTKAVSCKIVHQKLHSMYLVDAKLFV